jgi:hypothetical protein
MSDDIKMILVLLLLAIIAFSSGYLIGYKIGKREYDEEKKIDEFLKEDQ